MQLKAAGYLESRRGKLGGYLLARPPGEYLYWGLAQQRYESPTGFLPTVGA
jgi:hypothetical protein